MKIENGAAQQAYAAYQHGINAARATQQPVQPAEVEKAKQHDRADISVSGRQRAQALDAVRSAPESRGDLVNSLRDQVKNGNYTIDDRKLADHLVQHNLIG